MVKVLRRFVGPIVGFLVGGGLQVSGFEDMRVAIALWSIAGVWALIALFTWEPVHNFVKIIKRLRFHIEPVGNDTSNNRYSPSWLQEVLSSDIKRISKGMRGRVTRWDFTNIYNREPYFEIFVELTNTTIFTFYLKGVSGFMKIAGEKCVRLPDTSPRFNIERDEPEVIRLTQSIAPETAKLIQEFGNDNKELNFDLREVIFEIENTTKGYEKYKPYMTGGERSIVPKDGLKMEDKIEIDVRNCLVRKIEKQGYFLIDVEFTLTVSTLPIQLAQAQLCIADEVIELITVNPPIPRMLEAKVESYILRYEPSYQQVLKGRTTTLTREEELKFIVGQERWKANKYKAHLLLLVGGKDVDSEEFQINFSSFSVSS